MDDFLRHNPPQFNGKVNPDEADQWERDIEIIFEATQCPEERNLSYPMSIRDFPALVEKAKVVESLKSSSRLAKPQVGGPSKSMPKYEDRKKSYFRPQSYSSERPNSQSTPNFKCFRCGGPHVVRFCSHPMSIVTCDRCHKYGHAKKY